LQSKLVGAKQAPHRGFVPIASKIVAKFSITAELSFTNLLRRDGNHHLCLGLLARGKDRPYLRLDPFDLLLFLSLSRR
jgi:hypothetical protein